MKKQILFLAFFTLAIFFAGTKSYAQSQVETDALTAVPSFCTPAIALACGSIDALHPSPGVSYPYTITTSSAGSTVHFFVTDDASIITTQGAIAAAIELADGTSPYILTADAAYNDPASTALTVNITWKSFNGTANNVILVTYNIDAAGCTNNIEAWRIEPVYVFTLDVAGIADDGASGGAAVTECVVPIQSASYDGTDLTVDYGTNWVYFVVNAANWQTSWETDLVATLAAAGSTLGAPEWQYPDLANVATGWNASGTSVLASHYASGADGWIDNSGECIIVRVPVVHTGFENLASETINLVVNGEMINPETTAYDGVYPDLDEAGAGNACVSDNTTDNVDYVITPRPTVTDVTPQPFENKVF